MLRGSAIHESFFLDADMARINAAPVRVAAHVIAALGMLAFSCTDFGRRAHGVDPAYLVIATALFIIDHVEAAARIRDGSMFHRDAWSRRALAFIAPMIYTASFAAPSMYTAAPTWAFLAMGGVARGVGGYRLDRTFFATITLSGLGFHLLAAPDPTPLSIASAAAASLLACLSGVLGDRMVRLALELETRARVADELAEAARDEARRLAAAMSLHDGLSGLVFGVRAKLDVTEEPGAIRAAVLTLMQRTSELLAPIGGKVTLGPALADLSDVYGVSVELRGDVPGSLRPLEANDLAFSALELTANALRHRRPERVVVELAASPMRSVTVRAIGSSGALGGEPAARADGGRGSRHLLLRAQSWGGGTERRETDGEAVSIVSWPAPRRRPGPGWLGIAIPLSASLFGCVLWLGDAPTFALGFVGVGVVLSAAVVGLGAQALAAKSAHIDSRVHAREHALGGEGAAGRFGASVDALRASALKGDASEVRIRLVAFTDALQSLLRALEV
jgi:hypothetical protein